MVRQKRRPGAGSSLHGQGNVRLRPGDPEGAVRQEGQSRLRPHRRYVRIVPATGNPFAASPLKPNMTTALDQAQLFFAHVTRARARNTIFNSLPKPPMELR